MSSCTCSSAPIRALSTNAPGRTVRRSIARCDRPVPDRPPRRRRGRKRSFAARRRGEHHRIVRRQARALAERRREILIPALEPLFNATPRDCTIVIEAGALKKDSPLRRIVEQQKGAAAVECNADDAAALERVVDQDIAAAGLTIDPDARALLISLLGDDRLMTRAEMTSSRSMRTARDRSTSRRSRRSSPMRRPWRLMPRSTAPSRAGSIWSPKPCRVPSRLATTRACSSDRRCVTPSRCIASSSKPIAGCRSKRPSTAWRAVPVRSARPCCPRRRRGKPPGSPAPSTSGGSGPTHAPGAGVGRGHRHAAPCGRSLWRRLHGDMNTGRRTQPCARQASGLQAVANAVELVQACT